MAKFCYGNAVGGVRQGGLPACRILLVIERKLLVNSRVFLFQKPWCLEKSFAHDRKKLCRMFGAVGVEEQVLTPVEAGAEIVVGVLESGGPGTGGHAGRQPRVAVHFAVAHVQLVGEFVNHHVDAVKGVFCVEPRQQHRTAFPGFAEDFVVVFMHHAIFVGDPAGNDEITGINDDADPVGVGVDTDIQYWQAGLQGDGQKNVVGDEQPFGAVDFLVGEKFEGHAAQAGAFFRRQEVEERQGCLDARPLFG